MPRPVLYSPEVGTVALDEHEKYIAKVCVAPISPELVALDRKTIDLAKSPNALRDEVRDFFRDHDAA